MPTRYRVLIIGAYYEYRYRFVQLSLKTALKPNSDNVSAILL